MSESTHDVDRFSWKELFTDVLKSHTDDELEKHWAAGTIGNIPSIDKINTSCPKPWAFVRIFAVSLIVYLIFLFCWNKFHATNLLPGLIVMGTAAIPMSVLIFFFEMNVRKNVSIYLVAKMLIVGGAIAILFSLFMFKITEYFGLGWLGASVAGIAEEIGKLLAVILVIRNIRYPYILNGILFGAAIGAGFAIFESAGYALNILIMQIIDFSVLNSEKLLAIAKEASSSGTSGHDILSGLYQVMATKFDIEMLNNITLRGLLAPFGHIIWTAMVAGALWLVKGNRKFEIGMLVDIRFIGVLLVAIGLHMIWNSPWNFNFVCEFDKNILLGIIGWAIVFYLVKMGLKQLAMEQAQYSEIPQDEPGVSEIIEKQTIYIGQLVSESHISTGYDTRINQGYDHLNIADQVKASASHEQKRERPSFSSRSWQKYYNREEKEND